MCGIAGIFGVGLWQDRAEQVLESMTGRLIHRGPDGDGHWYSRDRAVALGHRRLAIVDLSETGRQPMVSRGGRYVITFNGEVYNFLELRDQLVRHGHVFRGHSDTEVMLGAFEQWGVASAVSRFNGMFAFAVWDEQERVLCLVRDRIGKKPLYYGWVGNVLIFASELKALRAVPGFSQEVDREALCQYMRHNYVPAPRSIYLGVSKLQPGHVTWFEMRGDAVQMREDSPYWDAARVMKEAGEHRVIVEEADAVDSLEKLLLDATRIRMISDVPLGAFLSGGLDSSTVVAMMQCQSAAPIRTFSVGFEQADYDEAHHARAVAAHIGTQHTEVYVTGKEALDIVPKLPDVYDEPFADSSQIPTLLLSAIAKRHVTVALSGDGGDEAFLGYNRYLWTRDLWLRMARLPVSLRGRIAGALQAVPSHGWDRIGGVLTALSPRLRRYRAIGDRVHKLAGILDARDPRSLYEGLLSHWRDPSSIVIGGRETGSIVPAGVGMGGMELFVEEMSRVDVANYLPDDILVKVDRASMAVSLETRAPLLDYRVIEFAAGLPYQLKIRGSEGKWLLRQVLYRHVPRELVERPKTGFGVPLDSWLRGPLRDWAETLLDASRLSAEGYFSPEPIRRMWNEHLSGARQWQYLLWDVLMFQAWLEASHSRRDVA